MGLLDKLNLHKKLNRTMRRDADKRFLRGYNEQIPKSSHMAEGARHMGEAMDKEKGMETIKEMRQNNNYKKMRQAIEKRKSGSAGRKD